MKIRWFIFYLFILSLTYELKYHPSDVHQTVIISLLRECVKISTAENLGPQPTYYADGKKKSSDLIFLNSMNNLLRHQLKLLCAWKRPLLVGKIILLQCLNSCMRLWSCPFLCVEYKGPKPILLLKVSLLLFPTTKKLHNHWHVNIFSIQNPRIQVRAQFALQKNSVSP